MIIPYHIYPEKRYFCEKLTDMKRSYLFLATGFEEIEALATVDVLRRAGMQVTIVSIYKERQVTGANGITAVADEVLAGVDLAEADWLIFPGGMPGAENLYRDSTLMDALRRHAARCGRIAAICAAPAVVLAQAGVLEGHDATCYPGFEPLMKQHGAKPVGGRVVIDGNIITGNGPSSALPFAYAIAAATVGKEAAQQVSDGMLY